MSTVYEEFKGFSIETKKHSKYHSMPMPHYHSGYELYIPLNGTSTIMVGDEIIGADKSMVILIPPHIPHGNFSKSEHERTVIYFDNDFLDMFLTPLFKKELIKCFNTKAVSPNDTDLKKLHFCTKKLLSNPEVNRSTIKSFAYLNEILLILNNSKKTVLPPFQNIDSTLGAILTYINVNFVEINNLQELADKFYISKSYLCRLFKNSTRLTVTKYINTLRINKSCELLKSTNLQATEIAYAVGYNSYTHFYKNFVEITSTTPYKYKTDKS